MVIKRVMCFTLRVTGFGSCKEIEELCYEYIEETVPKGAKRRVKRHLKICKPCLRFIMSYLAVRALGKTVLPTELSQQQKDKLIEGLTKA